MSSRDKVAARLERLLGASGSLAELWAGLEQLRREVGASEAELERWANRLLSRVAELQDADGMPSGSFSPGDALMDPTEPLGETAMELLLADPSGAAAELLDILCPEDRVRNAAAKD